MYPVTDPALHVGPLAEHWWCVLPGQPPVEEALTDLLRAYWQGDLELTFPDRARAVDRRMLLGVIADAVRGGDVDRNPAEREPTAGAECNLAFYTDEDEQPELGPVCKLTWPTAVPMLTCASGSRCRTTSGRGRPR